MAQRRKANSNQRTIEQGFIVGLLGVEAVSKSEARDLFAAAKTRRSVTAISPIFTPVAVPAGLPRAAAPNPLDIKAWSVDLLVSTPLPYYILAAKRLVGELHVGRVCEARKALSECSERLLANKSYDRLSFLLRELAKSSTANNEDQAWTSLCTDVTAVVQAQVSLTSHLGFEIDFSL